MTGQPEDRPRTLRKVVVVFKTHFDLGFTDLPDRVMASYTGPMFNAVQAVMQATAGAPEGLRYTWTLPAWPMQQFLHGAATPEATREAARRLVEERRLFWHAWPFTTHTAFCGLEDLVRGLQISRELSEEFGQWPTAAKQTDVPGHTWIFPSLLVRAGVRFLHLGCNAGSHPPHVPRLFWWEGPDGARLLTYYSVGGYGTSLLPPAGWTLDTWLAVQQTVDNIGPHSPEQLAAMREELERGAPGAELVFGQLGDFADSLFEHPEQLADLPVVPCDLADTWIHGVGTMPHEVRRVRALRDRLLQAENDAALAGWPTGATATADFPLARAVAPHIDAAYEQLLLFGEHTWGLDVKSTIKRAFGAEFEVARQSEPYRRLEDSWRAKAAYVDRAEEALARAESLLKDVRKLPPGPFGQTPEAAPVGDRNVLENSFLRVEVDPADGGIISLIDKSTGREWVDPHRTEPFGGYRYDLYSARDAAEYMRAYGLYFQDWFVQDFGKAGIPEDTEHVTAYARDFSVEKTTWPGGSSLTLSGGRLTPGGADPWMRVPDQRVSITLRLTGYWLDLEYHIEGKSATPIPESAVVPFPMNLPKATYRLGQTGSVIDPARDIAEGANRGLWCVDNWLHASDDRHGLGIIPVDMPLVSISNVGIFEFDPARVPGGSTVYSHLYNTQWGTNFPQWLEGDFSFRVRLVPGSGDWRGLQSGPVIHSTWHLANWTTRPAAARARLDDGRQAVRLPAGWVLLSMRPRHDGDGLIIRFWDQLGLARTLPVALLGPVGEVWRCDLLERPQTQLALMDHDIPGYGGVAVHVTPHAVETLWVRFAQGEGIEGGV